jgi:hypothetical protein
MSDIPPEVWLRIGEFGDMRMLSSTCCQMRQLFSNILPLSITVTAARILRGNMLLWLVEHHGRYLKCLTMRYEIPEAFTACSQSCANLLDVQKKVGACCCLTLSALAKCLNITSLTLKVTGPLDLRVLGEVSQKMKLQSLALDLPVCSEVDFGALKEMLFLGINCTSFRLGLGSTACDFHFVDPKVQPQNVRHIR